MEGEMLEGDAMVLNKHSHQSLWMTMRNNAQGGDKAPSHLLLPSSASPPGRHR